MISIFHVVAFVGCVVGLFFGAVFGHKTFGWFGTVLGLPLGAYIGLVIGRLPRVVAVWILRRRQAGVGSQPEVRKQQL